MRNAAVHQSHWGRRVMTSNPSEDAADLTGQAALLHTHAARLINRLYDRAVYVGDEEFAEIMSLVKVLRQFCGLDASSA